MSVTTLLRRISPLVIFLAAFLLYLSTLAPGLLRGDSGEFQWAMATLNVAHATGYPLFTLLGYGWQFFPLSNNLAWQLNLLAALFGALAVMMTYVLARAVTRRESASLIGAVILALTPVLWFNASILEVYPLHAFLLALWLYLLWRWSQTPAVNSPLYLSFFVFGLGLAHHRLMLLTVPALAYFLLATDRRFFFNVPRLLICALLVVPGLLLYAYVPLRLVPQGTSLEFAFFDIILGREYSGSLLREISPLPVLVEIPWANFGVGLVLVALGAVTLFRRVSQFNVALWLLLVADMLFALVYSVPDIEVFLTSAFVVMAIWASGGVAAIVEWLDGRVGVAQRQWIELAVTIVLAAVVLFGLTRYPQIQTAVAAERAPEERARAIAANSAIAPGAWLELDWETATALRFLQATEELRPDIEARLIEMHHGAEYWRTLGHVDAGRAVYIESGVPWKRAPAGYVLEDVGNNLKKIRLAPAEISRERTTISDQLDLVGYKLDDKDLTLFWRAKQRLNQDLATFVHYMDAQGNKLGQEDHAGCCEAVYGYRTSEWEPGRLYADVFRAPPDGTVALSVGLYEIVSGEIEPVGEQVSIQLLASDP